MPSTEIAAERAHAKRSPSSYKYVKACPGYIPQKNDILHPNTIRGTKIHEAIETGKYDDLDDQELRWLEYCLAEKQKIIAEIFGSNPYEEFKEIKVEVSARYKSWGFVDSILVSGAVGIMLDWKFGWGEVDDAEENEQGKGYAVAIYKKFPQLKKLVVAFVQPPIRKTTTISYTCLAARKMLKEIESYLGRGFRCDKNPVQYLKKFANPEPTMCLYCQRSKDLTCPVMSKSLKIIQSRVEELTYPARYNPANLPSNPADLVKIMRAKPLIDKIFDAANERLKTILEEGASVEGAELQHVSGRTTVKDVDCAKGVSLTVGLTEEDFYNCLSVSITDLKKAVSAKAPRGGKELAVEELVAKLSDAGAIEQGQPTTKLKILALEKPV